MTIIIPTTLRNHGGSLGINISKKLLEENGFADGDLVEITIKPLKINEKTKEETERIFNEVAKQKMKEENADVLIIKRENYEEETQELPPFNPE